jgi:hypothetical protein
MDLVVDAISMNDREGNITVKGGVSIGVIRTNPGIPPGSGVSDSAPFKKKLK